MQPLMLLALIAGIPLVLTIILRIKPLYLFVSIVSGYFGSQFLGDPAELMLRSFIHISNLAIICRVGLLLVPFIITLFLMRKTLSAAALPFQFILLVANSLLLATFLVPLLTPGIQGTIYMTNPGNIFRQSHDVLIPAIAGLHVIVMWIMRPRHEEAHAKHKRHK